MKRGGFYVNGNFERSSLEGVRDSLAPADAGSGRGFSAQSSVSNLANRTISGTRHPDVSAYEPRVAQYCQNGEYVWVA